MVQERTTTLTCGSSGCMCAHAYYRGRLSLCDNVTGLPPASMFHVAVVIWQATASLLATAWC